MNEWFISIINDANHAFGSLDLLNLCHGTFVSDFVNWSFIHSSTFFLMLFNWAWFFGVCVCVCAWWTRERERENQLNLIKTHHHQQQRQVGISGSLLYVCFFLSFLVFAVLFYFIFFLVWKFGKWLKFTDDYRWMKYLFPII